MILVLINKSYLIKYKLLRGKFTMSHLDGSNLAANLLFNTLDNKYNV